MRNMNWEQRINEAVDLLKNLSEVNKKLESKVI